MPATVPEKVRVNPLRFNLPEVRLREPVLVKFWPRSTSPLEELMVRLLTVKGEEGKVPVDVP